MCIYLLVHTLNMNDRGNQMKIKWENLANIKIAELETNDLTLIVGDNSLGKTVLLEAYALLINFLRDQQNEFMKDGFFSNIGLENSEELRLLDFFDFEEELSNDIDLKISYQTISNEELSDIVMELTKRYLKLLQDNIIGEVNENLKVEMLINAVEKEDIIPKNVIIEKNSKGHYFLRTVMENDESYKIRLPNNLTNNKVAFEGQIKNRLKYFLNFLYFIKIFDIKDILFFPSERNLYKSNAFRKSGSFIEETFSQEEVDSEMRYSESLFLKSYLDFIDYQDLLNQERSIQNAKKNPVIYGLICKFLGGEPMYEDGVVTKLKTDEGNEITRKLFSTKQSRLLPYIMLSSPLYRRNNIVIIEEPEAHMSLKSMFELVEMTENILTNHRLIMSSHSDVFVTMLNNMIKAKNIKANVYELLDTEYGATLTKVEPGPYGYELSFMSDQIIRLNNETLNIFEDEINENR